MFKGVKKSEIWRHFQHRSTLGPAFENAARYLNSETKSVGVDDGRISVYPLQVW